MERLLTKLLLMPASTFFGTSTVHIDSASERGFTAIELMVVVAIVAILAALAAPSFTPLIERWRVRDAAETLTSSLYFARSEAIKRGGNVIMEKSPNSSTCSSAGATTEWGCGWRVFFDVNSNGSQDACVPASTPNECDLQVIAAPSRLELNLTGSTGGISLDRWGMMSHTGGGSNVPADMAFALKPLGKNMSDPSAARLCSDRGGRVVRRKNTETC